MVTWMWKELNPFIPRLLLAMLFITAAECKLEHLLLLRQYLAMQPKEASESRSSCLSFSHMQKLQVYATIPR